MPSRAADLLREALALPIEERADVAAGLLASLDEEVDDRELVETEWAAEIERRALRVKTGASVGVPWDEVRLRTEQALRRP